MGLLFGCQADDLHEKNFKPPSFPNMPSMSPYRNHPIMRCGMAMKRMDRRRWLGRRVHAAPTTKPSDIGARPIRGPLHNDASPSALPCRLFLAALPYGYWDGHGGSPGEPQRNCRFGICRFEVPSTPTTWMQQLTPLRPDGQYE